MGYRRLFVWVEGPDDVRFFEKIVKPTFLKKYDWVEVRPYANLRKDNLVNFFVSIKAINADFLYVSDINNMPCVTAKKQRILNRLSFIGEDRIIVVRKEIEAWYLAGLTDANSRRHRIPLFSTTNNISKEQFNNLIPRKFESRIDFMLELLKSFSVPTARRKNESFNYFIQKLVAPQGAKSLRRAAFVE